MCHPQAKTLHNKHPIIVVCNYWTSVSKWYEVISVEFYGSVTLCVSPCSFHSVFSYHLLRGAAAASQHICHVPL